MLRGITELRSLPYLTLTDTAVTADTTICEIRGDIENNDVTFVSLQVCMEGAGKLYIVDENGYSMYLTDPSNDWPAKYQILSTFMVQSGTTVSLKYSASTTMSKLIIVQGGGVF